MCCCGCGLWLQVVAEEKAERRSRAVPLCRPMAAEALDMEGRAHIVSAPGPGRALRNGILSWLARSAALRLS